MRKPKLVYSLIRNGRNVVFTIYYMDERFRADNGDVIIFDAKNGIEVMSCMKPGISYPFRVYLRGVDSSGDEDIVVLTRPTKEEAEKFVKKVHEALRDWSENWEGFFKDKKDNCKSCIVEL